MKLKFDDLVAAVADLSPTTKADTRSVIDALARVIQGRTACGAEVRIPSLGTFRMVDRPAGVGRNPATGEAITVPATRRLKFTPTKTAKGKE